VAGPETLKNEWPTKVRPHCKTGEGRIFVAKNKSGEERFRTVSGRREEMTSRDKAKGGDSAIDPMDNQPGRRDGERGRNLGRNWSSQRSSFLSILLLSDMKHS
jgi:hypothetical protein